MVSCVDIQIVEEVKSELFSILNYWRSNTVDEVNSGFIGRRDFFNNPDLSADKGAILNTRILWTFSTAYLRFGNRVDLLMADRAYNYIVNHFIDREFEGIFWLLDAKGDVVDSKKQVYAQAFAIYALSEYYKASKKESALRLAYRIFELVEEHSFDSVNNGYVEALSRSWGKIEDMRLSEKDRNDSKTMNTHLHILEAYTTLYTATNGNKVVGAALKNLINLYVDKFVNAEGHLNLFFTDEWERTDLGVSYGHEIESAWLLVEAAEALSNASLIEKSKKACLSLMEGALEGVMDDGSMIYHRDALSNHTDYDRHWWIQAEAMVGYMQAYQLTDDVKYLDLLTNQWEYIMRLVKDKTNGEWHLIITDEGTPKQNEDKIGIWKCPYHNTRACLELLKRFEQNRI